jgi:two-component system sensor histidine kinase PilS (NtrC family)
MNRVELERHLRWLMTLRVVIVTTLLVSAFAIELLFSPAQSLRPVFLLAAVSYGMVLLYAVLDRWVQGTRGFTLLQLVGDALVITLFVQITGGLDSPMSFLYLLPIAAGALVLYRGGALILAGVCFLSYAALILFGAAWALLGPQGGGLASQPPGRIVYFLVAHLVAMVAVALLSAYLTERLRLQGHELVERRGAVARLQALNENIIESINSGLLTTTLAGTINFINRGGTAIIGYGQEELEDESVERRLGLEPGFLHEIRRRLLAERRFRFEQHFETKAGRRIYLGIAVSNLYDKTGHPIGYIFIFQDLTEIHALEQEVRLKERMAALGEMAAGIAHELRNPLASISGAVQYLKGTLDPQGETLELMDIILRESQRLDRTIRNFLTFTRPGEFAPQPTDLVRLLEENVKLLRKSRECDPRHRVVTRYAAPAMPCEIDPDRLKQVFWNLTTNALKAMPEGGTLTVGVEWKRGGEEVEIAFADEGVGMDAEQQRGYFQPFSGSFRDGTGLGAAIVYRLVGEHGGRIQLESDPGRGTCVRIRLPRRQAEASAGAVEAVRMIAGGEFR